MPSCRISWPLACLLAACGGGSSSTPIGGAHVPTEVVACRARVDSPFQFAEIALRNERNLGTDRVADRTGTERNVRLGPDGITIVFARERDHSDPDSRELFVSTIDGSLPETRITENNDLDDEPCWSPDGQRILFASERGGPSALWIAAQNGDNPQPFLAAPPLESDGEPDWCRTTDRIVFSRRAANGRHSLWLVQSNGTGSMALTNGGLGSGAGTGDRAPAMSPDGSRVAFVRRAATGVSALCIADVATGVVTVRWQPDGEVGTPRWAPTADRLFFGVSEPLRGRGTMRLASAPVAAGVPGLIWPDERWRLEGFDVTSTLGAAPVPNAPEALGVDDAQLQLVLGSGTAGSRNLMAAEDAQEYVLFTSIFEGRDKAGMNFRFDLPVLVAANVLEMRVRAVARTSRGGGDAALRMSIYNPVDERFDTVVELPADTTARTLEFRTSSLRHVTSERQLRFTLIGDLPQGGTAELRIDAVQVEIVTRTVP